MSNTGLKENRSRQLAKSVEFAQKALVTNLENEVNNLEMKLDKLTDLGPDSTTSLRPGQEIDANKWVADFQETSIALDVKKVELKIAKATLITFFTEEETKTETKTETND